MARRSVGCLSLGPWIPFLLPHPFYNIFLFTAYYLFKLNHVTFSATSCLLLSLHSLLGPRGPLIEPSIPVPSVRPSVHPSATIFPEFIDEL